MAHKTVTLSLFIINVTGLLVMLGIALGNPSYSGLIVIIAGGFFTLVNLVSLIYFQFAEKNAKAAITSLAWMLIQPVACVLILFFVVFGMYYRG